jgi:hypothetical protein
VCAVARGADELHREAEETRGCVDRLSEKMRTSRAQTPSLAHREQPDPAWGLGYEETLHRERGMLADLARLLAPKPERDQSRGLSR